MPVAPGRPWRGAVRSLQAAARGGPELELLVVAGRQPSQQRNLAAQEARGEFLYFIDNDTFVQPGTIRRLVSAMRRSGAAMAGGPTPGHRLRSWFARAFERVVGSPVGSPLVFRRYRSPDGRSREAGEKSLMLCNLMARRETFLESGGFDPRLYPNEENELISRVLAGGGRAVHVGDAEARKPREHSPLDVAVETWRYGRGRMEQIWTNPHWSDLPFVAIPTAAVAALASPCGEWLAAGYAALVVAESARLSATGGNPWRDVPATAVLIFVRHLSYLSGALWGAMTGIRARSFRVRPLRFEITRFGIRGGRARRTGSVAYEIGFPGAKEAT